MRRLLLGIFALLLPLPARAYVAFPITTTLEWEIASADVVVRGTVHPTRTKGEYQVDIDEVLKGQAPSFLRFREQTNGWPPVGGESQVLICLRVKTGGAAANTASEEVRELAPSSSWLVGRLASEVFRMDGSQLKDAAGILAAAREAAKRPATGTAPVSLNLAFNKLPREIFERMGPWARALQVPVDDRLLEQSRRWCASDKADYRLAGLNILLFAFPRDPLTAQTCRALLKDPHYEVAEPEEWSRRIEERARRVYPVRALALIGLDTLEMPQPGDAELPLLRYAAVSWLFWASLLSAIGLVFLLWLTRRLTLRGGIALLCLAAALLLCGLAWRSRTRCDTWSLAAGGASYELTSLRGVVGVLRVQDDAPPHPLMRRSFVSHADRFWFSRYLSPAHESSWKQFASATGQTTGSAAYGFRFAQFPHWALIVVLMLLPAYHLASRAGAALRRRKWRRSNRCPQCGYDLRGGHSRCPECGHI